MTLPNPVNDFKLDDTCENCTWLVKGKQIEKTGKFTWSCRFYHMAFSTTSPPFPTRLPHCNIDGRIDIKKYQDRKNHAKQPEQPRTEQPSEQSDETIITVRERPE